MNERKKRAKKEDMDIENIDGVLFKVNDEYTVDMDEKTCTCPDSKYRNRKCKHIYKVEMMIEKMIYG